MKSKIIAVAIFGVFTFSCGENKYHYTATGNPEYIPNTEFISYEDLSSPRFASLKKKYQLDTIFHGEKDELKRILLLRNWIRKVIKIDNIGPYPGDGSAESILDEAIKGHGFHCGHYSMVQEAVMNAYGYVSRFVRVDDSDPVTGEGHHAVNEIWLNTYHKWFMSDTKYNYHFEKNGIPLSALEIRAEYLKNRAADIILVKGPDRIPTEVYPELKNRSKELFARIFTWISWSKYNDEYTSYPNEHSELIVYDDDYFRSHVWMRGGKPHWAYHTIYFDSITDRKKIEWTPNTISANIKISKDTAHIALFSSAPNLKSYQMRESPEAAWINVDSSLAFKLKKDNAQVAFRTMNLADVSGPEYHLTISR